MPNLNFMLPVLYIKPSPGTICTLLRMARKKSSKANEETKTSFMYPGLHQDVENAVSDKIHSVRFHKQDSDTRANNNHPTHVTGKFTCNNNACSKDVWTSKMIAILIRDILAMGTTPWCSTSAASLATG